MVKLFIDSSTLISAIISKNGGAREIILKSIQGEYKLFISSLVREETEHNITNKAYKTAPYLKILMETIPFMYVKPERELVAKVTEYIEWKDAPIVAAAITAKADFLVTHDQVHLLSYKELIYKKFKLKVVTPGDVLQYTAK